MSEGDEQTLKTDPRARATMGRGTVNPQSVEFHTPRSAHHLNLSCERRVALLVVELIGDSSGLMSRALG